MRLRMVGAGVVVVLGGCNRVPANIDFERMIDQAKFEAYEADWTNPERGVMRHPPVGTVPRDRELDEQSRIPGSVDRRVLERGRDRFDRFCAACHGLSGHGNEPVVENMALRPPPSLHEPRIKRQSPATIYATITHGYGLMPGYATALEPRDRWAVIAYLEALWLSQAVELAALPEAAQARARRSLQ